MPAAVFLGTRTFDERATTRRICDELYVMWGAARGEANLAYEAWCADRTRDAYAVYVAAEDRADAAEREYAAACTSMPAPVF